MKRNCALFPPLPISICTEEVRRHLALAFDEERGRILLNYTSCPVAGIPIPVGVCSHISVRFFH